MDAIARWISRNHENTRAVFRAILAFGGPPCRDNRCGGHVALPRKRRNIVGVPFAPHHIPFAFLSAVIL